VDKYFLTTTDTALDRGHPEILKLSLFRYVETSADNVHKYYLTTTDTALDREHPEILRDGGLYTFQACI
jgi:hypothetical protein